MLATFGSGFLAAEFVKLDIRIPLFCVVSFCTEKLNKLNVWMAEANGTFD